MGLLTPILLWLCYVQGLSQIVEFLLQLGGAAHPDAADSPDSNGDTPLHAAACNGHEACVNLLLRYAKFPAVWHAYHRSHCVKTEELYVCHRLYAMAY